MKKIETIYQANEAAETTGCSRDNWMQRQTWQSQCALLTIIISPSHLAHNMDKRTRANGNGDIRA